jgi:hypothetical protein
VATVVGESENSDAVFGTSAQARGVVGVSTAAAGVEGNSGSADGVFGISEQGRGVVGVAKGGSTGVEGNSQSGPGVIGISEQGRGVVGVAKGGSAGVEGNSQSGPGVFAQSGSGIAVHAHGGRLAALFEGDVEVTGDIRLVNAADCAEAFDVVASNSVEAGTVMVLDDGGGLRACAGAYDHRVAGIVSGAGGYKPGLVLDARPSSRPRPVIALMGKVYCKVDAEYCAIHVGDLLTTSPTEGYAMKATDPRQAFGAVIGKAMAPLASGRGLIPVLAALQ